MVEFQLGKEVSKLTKIGQCVARVILSLAVIFCLIGIFSNVVQTEPFTDTSVLDEWTHADGSPAPLDAFWDMTNGESVFLNVDALNGGQTLVFNARNMFVDVYADGVLLEEDDRNISRLFGTSPGTRWHTVNLPNSEQTIRLELRGYACYSNSPGYVEQIYLGNITNIYHKIATENMLVLILNIFWEFMGFLLILVYFFSHKTYHFEVDYLYLAIGTFFCAQWCSSEINLWQFYLGHSEVFHLLAYISLFTIPIPFALLAAMHLDGIPRKCAEILTLVAECNLVVMSVLHLTGILEYHYTVKSAHVLILLLVPLQIGVVIKYTQKAVSKKTAIFLAFVALALVLCMVVGLVRYGLGHYADYAVYIRLSLFFFLLLLLIYQFAGLNEVYIKGMESELEHEMALLDYLTKFYNRSGFSEHQAEYEQAVKNGEPFGIIQFDVNNLKQVNDNQGHEKGDELLCLASSGIYQSFGSVGKCYRMGGDEFLVVLNGEDPESDYRTGIENLDIYCGYANSVEDRTFDLKIAHGFTMLREGETLTQLMERADALMYENKKRMKQQNL